METKIELPSKNTPIFDMDDLSFFRFYGLGLRHTELDLGIKEAQSDNNSGDAVSLACYGRQPENWHEFSFDPALCAPFQEKVEAFILGCLLNWHPVSGHYQDVAFSLIMRGSDARSPYDFRSYPLGKCGKTEFTSSQIMALMTTENDVNDDINHAVYHVLLRLKAVCQKLKLEKAQALLEKAPSEFQDLLQTLIEHYQNDTFLEKPFFLTISIHIDSLQMDLPELSMYVQEENIKSGTTTGWFQEKKIEPSVLKSWMQSADKNHTKGANTLKILYEPEDLAAMDPQTLSKRLCHYISAQNPSKVQLCIKLLSTTGFNPEKDQTIPNPLRLAAVSSVEILKAVYEFMPEQYDLLIKNNTVTTPIFLAAYDIKKDNLVYLLSVRQLVARDVSFFNNSNQMEKHVFLGPAASDEADAYDIMQLLISSGASYGFDIDNNDIYGNPLSAVTKMHSNDNSSKIKFEMLLPHANAKCKYLAILSATVELYYCYGAGPRKQFSYDEEYSAARINQLFEFRNQIFASLTQKECEEIYAIFQSQISFSKPAERILLDDLKFEIKENTDKNVVKNIQSCFDFTAPEKKETLSVTQVKTTMYYQKPAHQPDLDTPLLDNHQVKSVEDQSCCVIL